MAILLLKQILSLALLMACGFLLVKLKLLKGEDSRALSVISIYLIMPCVMIRSFQIELTADIRNGFLVAVGVSAAIHVLLLIITAIIRRVIGASPVERCSMVYSNAGNLIIPLVTAILGPEWVIYASAFMCVQLVFLWTHCQSELQGKHGISWKKILTNVNLIAIAVGLVLMLLHIRLPEILDNAMASLSSTIGPVAMIMIGMLLARTDVRAYLKNKGFYLTLFCRLILLPLVVLCLLKVTGAAGWVTDGKTILYITYLAAITPTAATVSQIAQLYDADSAYAGAINAVGTVLCIATMPLMTQLYMLWI